MGIEHGFFLSPLLQPGMGRLGRRIKSSIVQQANLISAEMFSLEYEQVFHGK